MDPKRKRPESDDLAVLDLTLSQDIELPFEDEEDPHAAEESFHQDDFETR